MAAMGGVDAREELGGFDRHADPTHAEAPADVEYQFPDHRMEMEVVVRVDVIEREPGRLERHKLRFDLRGNLAAYSGSQGDIDACFAEVAAQLPVAADEIRDALRRQKRGPVDQHEMQPDAKLR